MLKPNAPIKAKPGVRAQKLYGVEPLYVAQDLSDIVDLPVFNIPAFSTPIGSGQFDPAIEGDVIPVEMVTGATVIRFHNAVKNKGIASLSGAGFKVASLTDFKTTGLPRASAKKPDVIYFERFGIAIVGESEPLKTMSVLTGNAMVASQRPERIYRALGVPGRRGPGLLAKGQPNVSREYLLGYKAGMSALIDHLLAGEAKEAQYGLESSFDESSVTWGLQATGVATSRFSGAGIRIAILDTGFDLSHPDFAGRSITSKSFIPGEDVQDGNGHGTHTAGTACGPLKPSSQPRYGIAYNAEMFIGKVLGNSGYGTDRSIIAGLDWALEQKCVIISMSLGAEVRAGEAYIDDFEHIGEVSLDAGSLVVAAAGNNSQRPGLIAPVNSPANCPSILAVAAIDSAIQVAELSAGSVNAGQAVDLAAPGIDVLSSWPKGYRRLNGTSMATPHVAGIAALFAEEDKRNRGRALWNTLCQRSKALPLPSTDIGKGLVQAT
jgi:subtilisin family serine protease